MLVAAVGFSPGLGHSALFLLHYWAIPGREFQGDIGSHLLM